MSKRTFLDTGVLIAAFQGKDAVGRSALEVLNDPDRVFLSSAFIRLELIPKPLFHKFEHEIAFHRAYFERVGEWAPVSEPLVERAILRAGEFNLGPRDSLHVAAAELLEADEMITTERVEKPMFRVPALKLVSLRPAAAP